jgi:hypothetical protein
MIMAETTRSRLAQLMIEAMAKHLPPSASQLRLLDVNGEAGEILSGLRDDLEVISVPGQASQWTVDSNFADAIVAYAYVLNDEFLTCVMDALRPGGRLIVIDPNGEVREQTGKTLEAAGYARILVETAVECPLPTGVLMRGEKPHTTNDTLARVGQVAERDPNMLDLASYKGQYVHLLIAQSPNKPVWNMENGEVIQWRAATIQYIGQATLLAFSSLPKAVGFMQPAVLNGKIQDVNKVGKFSKATAAMWTLPVVLNPDIASLDDSDVIFIDIDPATAEASDE